MSSGLYLFFEMYWTYSKETIRIESMLDLPITFFTSSKKLASDRKMPSTISPLPPLEV